MGGHAPEGWESGVLESPTPGGGGGVTHLYPRPPRPQSLGLHPSREQSQRRGASQQGHPLWKGRARNSLGKDPRPTRMVGYLNLTVPQGCSLGRGGPVWGAGPLAPGQTWCLGNDAPPRGTQSCRHLAGRRRGTAEGKGGPSRCWRAPQLAHFPISGGRRGWYPPPGLPSSPQAHFAMSRLQERCQRALGQDACSRREHSCRT